jgi:hypothetical protein
MSSGKLLKLLTLPAVMIAQLLHQGMRLNSPVLDKRQYYQGFNQGDAACVCAIYYFRSCLKARKL